MPNLLIFSDVHREFCPDKHRFDFPDDPELIVVAAGDIHPGVKGLMWLRDTFPKNRIVAVGGNHEFYGRELRYDKLFAKAAELGIDFLQNTSVVIEGITFIGATLWTDYNLFGPYRRDGAMVMAAGKLNDFCKITFPKSSKSITPYLLAQYHAESISFLERALADAIGPTVVVTHHAPSVHSVPERFANDILSASYASDLEQFIRAYNPELWIHGHTHDSFDYVIGQTRIICNPYGYRGHEVNPAFNPRCIQALSV